MSYDIPEPVPIPADVDMPDKVLAGLTARQVAIATVAAVIIWAGFQATRHVMPLPAFAALASPVGLAAVALVIGERDGLPLDRLLLAAWRQRRAPRRLVTAPEGVPAPPAWAAVPGPPAPPPAVLAPLWQHIGPDGVIGLGSAGAAAVAAVSTVNFALRSPEEQDALAAAYGRWLNSLTGPGAGPGPGRAGRPVQCRRRRCATPPRACRTRPWSRPPWSTPPSSRGWPPSGTCSPARRCWSSASPATAPACPGGTAAGRALQRAGEAARLLAGADLQVQVLDGGQVTGLLAACADPGAPPQPAGRAALPGRPVTSAGRPA